MTEVGVTSAAEDLGSFHEQAVVRKCCHIIFRYGCPETGPTRAGVKLFFRTEQIKTASRALIDAISLEIVIGAGKRGFGSLFPHYLELLRCQLLSPFLL